MAAIIGAVVSSTLFYYFSHRDKVAVVHSEVYQEFLPKGTQERTRWGEIITRVCDVLSVEVTCELVLTHGKQELEEKEALT